MDEKLKEEIKALFADDIKRIEMKIDYMVDLLETMVTLQDSDDIDDEDIEDFDTDETWVPEAENTDDEETVRDFWEDYDPEESDP